MSGKRYKGLSRTAASHHGSRGITKTVLKPSLQSQRKAAAAVQRAGTIAAMCGHDQKLVEQMDLDNNGEDSHEDFSIPDSIPPGEEGFGLSHEGGEFEAFHSFADDLAQLTGRRRYDNRDRRDRVEIRNSHWDLQFDKLTDGYLLWCQLKESPLPPPSEPSAGEPHHPDTPRTSDIMHTDEEMMETPPQEVDELTGDATGPQREGTDIFEIEVIDVFDRDRRAFVMAPDDTFHNVTLIRNGFLGSSPLHPTVAISLQALELYRQTHRTCPRYSIQAQVRTLCHLHNIPYRRYLTEQFAIAFDVYLEILHRIDLRVNAALHRDSPNWRLQNCCPPCFFQLEDEEPLEFSFLCEMDGNNSLKRTDAAFRELLDRHDSRTYRSDYWVTPEEVNQYKDEVKAHTDQGKGRMRASVDDADPDWVDDTTYDPVATCIERWKNAGPDERKRMFAMYAECGIFLVACRHGHILLVCDMVRSGELAKYPLAMVKKLIEIYGPDIVCGYDIACAFSKTLAASSLGAEASAQRFRLILGSFHGYGHNALCQADWHPRNVNGMGRANFEGCERVFAASNGVAALTRHATQFHRHQAIEQHFAFWDEDKYAALSRFIQNHYREALTIVTEWPQQIAAKTAELGLGNLDFDGHLNREREYLRSLKQEPPAETLQFDYVDALDKLKAHRSDWVAAQAAVQNMRYQIATPGLQQAMTKANRQVRTTLNRVQTAEAHVAFLEDQLNIDGDRWEETSEEYQKMKQEATHRAYRKALDELERLVVQRLFELSKLNMSGTGYKLRVHIAKALQRRSEAIRSALTRYNHQAQRLIPPRPVLTWKEIVDYSFLGEFDLLRDSRTDVRQEDWAKPAHRALTIQYQELRRAKEEITRLNVEVRRLRTAIHQESLDYETAISQLQESDPPLAAELRRRWILRGAVNTLHEWRLQRVMAMPGYSGRQDLGVRRGAQSTAPSGEHSSTTREMDSAPSVEQLEDEQYEEQTGGQVQYGEISEDVEAFTDFVDTIVD